MKDLPAPTRRGFLTGAAAASTLGLTGSLPAATALAKAPMQKIQAPAFYRFNVGAFEATVVSDGPLHLGPPSANVFVGLTAEAMSKAFADNFLAVDDILLEQNALVINTGRQLVLFDTGTGIGTSPLFSKNTGRLVANLKSAGIQPEDLDAVVITHAHGDHCFGLMTDTGKPNFPNAQIYMTLSDLAFWTDERNGINDMFKAMIAGTRAQLLPNRDRIVTIKDGQEILPGIQAIAAPGHTVGHSVFMITSEGKSLCNAGDLGHHHVISLAMPKLPFAFDTDGQQAVASRLRIYDMLASARIPMVGYHFPWPGIGYVGRQGDAFRYFPQQLRPVL